jgi:hypothetical protein
MARSLDAAGFSPDELSFGARFAGMEHLIAADGLVGLERGLGWLRAHRPAEPRWLAICHGDLTPSNILVEDGRVSGVLDWSGVSIADPALDLGATLTRIATVPLQVPGLIAPLLNLCRREFAAAYVRAYSRALPIDRAAIRYYRVFSCMQQLTWLGHLIVLGKPIFGAQSVFAIASRAIGQIRRLSRVAVALPTFAPSLAAGITQYLPSPGATANAPLAH